MTVGVKHIDKPIARTGNVIVFCRILLRIGDKKIAVDVLDAEWRIASWNFWVGKVSVDLLRRCRSEAGRAVPGKHVDRPGAEVGSIEKDAVDLGAENEAFVNRARRVVDREDCLIQWGEAAGPSRNSSVLGVPYERGWQVRSRNQKAGDDIRGLGPHETGGRRRRWARRMVRVNMFTGASGYAAPG